MDLLKGESLDLNDNFNLLRFADAQESNSHVVNTTRAEFVFEDGEIKVQENALNKHRKSISIYNTVERLNKHPKLFINYLRRLAEAKGIKFEVQAKPEGTTTTKRNTKANARVANTESQGFGPRGVRATPAQEESWQNYNTREPPS